MFDRRTMQSLARLVLAWFALFVAVASLAQAARSPGLDIVCSASGGTTMVVDLGGQDGAAATAHGLDCVLCLPCCAPPPHAQAAPLPLAQSGTPGPAAAARHVFGASAAPPPGRGPPLSI